MTFIEVFNPCPCPFEGRPSNHLNNKLDRFLSLRKNVSFRWKGMGRLINGSQSAFCRFCLLMYRAQRKFIGSHDRVSGNRTCLRHGLIQGLKRCQQDSLSLLSSSWLGRILRAAPPVGKGMAAVSATPISQFSPAMRE